MNVFLKQFGILMPYYTLCYNTCAWPKCPSMTKLYFSHDVLPFRVKFEALRIQSVLIQNGGSAMIMLVITLSIVAYSFHFLKKMKQTNTSYFLIVFIKMY